MKQKNKNLRHRSKEISRSMAIHHFDRSINVQNSAKFTAVSGMDINHLPRRRRYLASQQPTVEVENVKADATNNQTANTPKQAPTSSPDRSRSLVDNLTLVAPVAAILTAGVLLTTSLIKKRA